MQREMIDNYLDGALTAGAQLEVEKALTQDAAAKKLLASIKTERAIRAAVYNSYLPAPQEAASYAAQLLAACEDEALAPVGRVGLWTHMRRYASIAAMIVIAAGSFVMGRTTAPVAKTDPVETKTVYELAYTDQASGTTLVRQFASEDERTSFISQDLTQARNTYASLAENLPQFKF